MREWILIACLKALFAEFDKEYPYRKHDSDGSIGDTAHQEETSDHNADEVGNVPIHDADDTNEVHAIDVDNRLDGTLRIDQPDDPMEKKVQLVLARCRSGAEKRLRYVIYNRRIWKASNDWRQETYKGTSPHREHAHFSASYDTALEASTAPWGIYQEDTVDQGDKDDIINGVVSKLTSTITFTDKLGGATTKVGDAVLAAGFPGLPGEDRAAAWFQIQRVHVAARQALSMLATQDTKLAQLLAAAGLEAAEVPPTADDIATAVFMKLGSPGVTDQAAAAALVAAMGRDRARAVAAAIQATA